MNLLQRRAEPRKRKEVKKRFIKYVLLPFLIMALFLLYGIWPRNGNSLVSPFEPKASTMPQKMMTEEIVYIYPLDSFSGSSKSIIASQEVTQEVNVEAIKEATTKIATEEGYVYNITENERKLLLKLVFCEANTESIECQMAVIQVVFNRVAHDAFPNNIHDVLYEKHQFSPVGTKWFNNAKYNKNNIEALERVLKGEKIVSENVMFFWSTKINVSKPGTWCYNMHRNKFCIKIDNTRFYYV